MRRSAFLLLALPSIAHAEREPARDQGALVEDGEVAPALHGLPGGRATLALTGGWDTATDAPIVDANLEVQLWRRLFALASVDYADQLRPGVGAAVRLTDAVAASFRYKPEGFTEPEGELELGVAITQRLGRATAIANLAYGQDPEARERDAEEGLGVVVRLTGRLAAGITERARVSLGMPINGEPWWDVVVGPHAVLDLDHVLVVGFAGLTARRLDDQRADAGIAASVGVARTF